MKLIPLTQGYFAKVDDEDFESLNQYKWSSNIIKGKVYAERKLKRVKGQPRKAIRMHRQVMKVTETGQLVDHRDHDTINNQKYNLLVCNHSTNNHNRIKKPGCSSIFPGVALFKRTNRWRAVIKENGKPIYLGYFDNEIQAAKAYYVKAKEIHGQNVSPLLDELLVKLELND